MKRTAKRDNRSRSRDMSPKVDLNPFSQFSKSQLSGLATKFKQNVPFPHLSLNDFFNQDYLSKLKNEVLDLEFFEKSNDLFHFQQSNDLKKITTPQITQLKKVLYSDEFRKALQTITGVEL